MAKSRKKKGEINEEVFVKNTMDEQSVVEFTPCEWCVQFDEDPPIRFAYMPEDSTSKEVVITLGNDSSAFLCFTNPDNNKSFKIFARKPLS